MEFDCLINSKIPQISKTFFRIMTDLGSAVVWNVSICPMIPYSSKPFGKNLEERFKHDNFS